MKRQIIEQVEAVALNQLGLISGRQADAIGMSEAMRRNAIAHGWMHTERRGVLVLAGQPPSRWRSTFAAALAAGPAAAISDTTAARIDSFYGVAGEEIELTVVRGPNPRLAGVRVHQTTTLTPDDLQRRHGILVTSPIRTIIDLAPRFEAPLLGKIIDEGTLAGLWTPESVASRLDHFQVPPPGAARLRPLLALRTGERRPDSALEQRVIRVVKRHFPGYVIHYELLIEGKIFILDIAWPAQRVAAEVDGMAVHATSRSKFERDRERTNVLGRHDWRIVHLTAGMDDAAIVGDLAPHLRPAGARTTAD